MTDIVELLLKPPLYPLHEKAAEEIKRLRAALQKIDTTIADCERVLCIPTTAELKHIWYIAREALK